ncbi:AAA family ATPase [Granulosicoccus antarcticus]|uniref:non-specific protein-tyrosine kinase n=1 Tax=Granulosicoccus antarcticus IMCC3135 TaxID=1192854 RepID=A0A2Z2NMF7_9GAMM|nr:AAA family ATPase [Granulosicoccus antarcticus]ASJ72546.1 Tyrosine-protein kinase ptk [Granulosicoccus antarcticus IMCC3135]
MKNFNYQQPGGPMQGYATVPATSDAKEYLRLLMRHKIGLLFTLLLGLFCAWLFLISTDKTYETSALIEVKEERNYFDDAGNVAQTDWNAPTIKEEANLLRSRKVLSPVVEAFDLRTSANPKTVPVLSALTTKIPVLGDLIGKLSFASSYAWNDVSISIAELSVPRQWEDQGLTLTTLEGNAYSLADSDANLLIERAEVGTSVTVEIPNRDPMTINVAELDAPAGVEFSVARASLQAAVSALRSNLSTETTDSKSRMITVKQRGNDPALIAELTNAVLSEYTSVKLGSQNRSSDGKLEVYEEQLPKVEAELRAAELALSDFRRTAGSFGEDTQINFKLGQLDKLETDLIEKEVERDDLLKRYTVSHPTPKRLQKEIDVLNDKIRQVRGTLSARPDTQRELAVLEDELETKRTLFIEVKESLQKLRLSNVGNVGEVQIIDDALAPRKPISPSSLLAIVGGTLTTLFLYTLYLTLRSALSTVISDQDSLERASGLPVFMNIPKSTAQRRLGSPATVDPRKLLPGGDGGSSSKAISGNVLALSKPEDYSIENLRGLRSMLEDLMAEADNNVLMFTSPLPSMGKSFLSMNLAVLVAQSGKKVLLIDADYQRGQLHKSLGLAVGPGLPEVVRGKSELKETVKATTVPNLYCIPRGYSGGSNSTDMPSDKEFGAFLNVVAPRFDICIIDTPPVLSVSTAASLGKHAGSTIMVVKEGEVKEPQLNEALKRLSFSGVRVSGCIMNGSSTPTPKHYTYYQEQLD